MVGINGDGKIFVCDITDDMPFGVRTASSSSVIILLTSGVDKLKLGVTKMGACWPPRGTRGFVKSSDRSIFVFSILYNHLLPIGTV